MQGGPHIGNLIRRCSGQLVSLHTIDLAAEMTTQQSDQSINYSSMQKLQLHERQTFKRRMHYALDDRFALSWAESLRPLNATTLNIKIGYSVHNTVT